MMADEEVFEEASASRYQGFNVSDNSLDFLHNPEPLLDKLTHLLKRERFDFNTKSYIKIEGLKPMMNPQGIEDLMLELSGRISVVMELGQLDEKIFQEIRRGVGDAVLDLIHFRAAEYELDEADYSRLFHLVLDCVTGFLSRPLEGFESKQLNQRFGVKELVQKRAGENTQPMNQQKKWWPLG